MENKLSKDKDKKVKIEFNLKEELKNWFFRWHRRPVTGRCLIELKNRDKEFIKRLKEEINDNGAKNVVKDIRGNCSAGYGIEYRILFNIIAKLTGDKFK